MESVGYGITKGLSFNELSSACKMALLEYCYMSCETMEDVRLMYKNNSFTFEIISIEESKKRCMQFPFDAGDFLTFEEYHEWYIKGGDIPYYGESMYPVIQGGDGEWLDDGWHRFHSYILYKKGFIPVLTIESNKQNITGG
ncbi:hypothetical protein [Bacillus cereus group sp. MG11]|uniref:hypothetical protein n=1 Tax=Bacillus cereus group sp. MG11 TaxID=3040248 RepID=UPI00339A933D